MEKKYHFRVKTGYGKNDFLSIDETELAMAIRAQITGKVAVFKSGTVSGNHIMSVIPDWNKELGYHGDYVLNGEDISEIGSNRKSEYQNLIENVTQEVTAQIEGKPLPARIERPVRIHKGMQSIENLLEGK